jgi:hypothetical protein
MGITGVAFSPELLFTQYNQSCGFFSLHKKICSYRVFIPVSSFAFFPSAERKSASGLPFSGFNFRHLLIIE